MYYDYIIIGQGLAATVLAKELEKRGQTSYLIDYQHQGSSSLVAAGLLNPLTGRRLAQSWNYQQFYREAEPFYRALELEYGEQFFQTRQVAMLLGDTQARNSWDARSGQEDVQAYVQNIQSYWPELAEFFPQAEAAAEFGQAARLDLPLLLQCLRRDWERQGRLSNTRFDFDALHTSDSGIEYKGIEAKALLCCEGHAAQNNPFFPNLPFRTAKGEVLLLEIPALAPFEQLLIKQKVFFAHWREQSFWVGSFYEWDTSCEGPTEAGKAKILEAVEEVLACDYTIQAHWAAIRPTVKDRRPLLGKAKGKPLYIFNGLGTKGSLLAPALARQFCEYLLEGKALDKEISIERFL